MNEQAAAAAAYVRVPEANDDNCIADGEKEGGEFFKPQVSRWGTEARGEGRFSCLRLRPNCMSPRCLMSRGGHTYIQVLSQISSLRGSEGRSKEGRSF